MTDRISETRLREMHDNLACYDDPDYIETITVGTLQAIVSELLTLRQDADALEAQRARVSELERERDEAVSENDTGTDALLASVEAHLALEDEIMACETFDVFLVLQARLRIQREADVAATKAAVERAIARFKQGPTP